MHCLCIIADFLTMMPEPGLNISSPLLLALRKVSNGMHKIDLIQEFVVLAGTNSFFFEYANTVQFIKLNNNYLCNQVSQFWIICIDCK